MNEAKLEVVDNLATTAGLSEFRQARGACFTDWSSYILKNVRNLLNLGEMKQKQVLRWDLKPQF